MERPTRRSLSRWLTVCLLTLLVSGCTPPSLPDQLTQWQWPWRADQPDPAADTAVDLRVLAPEEGDATERLRQRLDEFSHNTGVEVTLTVAEDAYNLAVRRTLESDAPPDLFVLDAFSFPSLVTEEQIAAPRGSLGDSSDFVPQLVDAFRHDGVLYCLPREVRTLALVYDAAALQQTGLQPPSDWGQLEQAAERLTNPDIARFGLIVAPDLSRWLPFLYQAGGQLIQDGQMGLETPETERALSFYIGLFRQNVAGQPAESNSSWAGEVLGKGKGGMAVEGNWIVPYFAREFPDFEYGIAPLPSGPGGRGSVAFTSCYAVSAHSQRPDLAFDLANHLASLDAMRSWTDTPAFMPTRLSLQPQWLAEYAELAPFANAVDEAIVWQFPPGFETFVVAFNRSMLQLFAADIDAADLLFEMQRIGQTILN